MDHPRKEIPDPSGGYYPYDILLTPVKHASFELALSSLDTDRMADPDMAGLAEVRAASLMIKMDKKDFNSDKPDAIPDKIWKILDGLVFRAGIGVVRLHRA